MRIDDIEVVAELEEVFTHQLVVIPEHINHSLGEIEYLPTLPPNVVHNHSFSHKIDAPEEEVQKQVDHLEH